MAERSAIRIPDFFIIIYICLQIYNLPDFRMYLRAGERQGTWSDVAGDA